MSQRKIHNFESKILVEETIKEFGYNPNLLGKTSSLFIIAICRFCGKHHKIRKGFFNKSGSACHKECKIMEIKQSISPFSNPEVIAKAKQTNIERYGSEFASQNKEIAKKISKVKSSQESLERMKKTNLERYGVENPFRSEEIKEKIRKINLERYGTEYTMQLKSVKDKTKITLMERYGVDNIRKSEEHRKKAIESFKNNIANDDTGKFVVINALRSEAFWEYIEQSSLTETCQKFNLNYQTVASTLSKDEFKDRFRKIYSYPKHQKQKELKDLIESLGFNAILDDRNIIAPSEVDIFIPDKNFAIEFNGSYWHSEACLEPKKARNKHIKKTKLCREKGIRLFHIFEHYWDERREKILNFIKTILGVNNISIGARDCIINNDICKEFLENNHLQGYGTGTIKFFNLKYNDEIIASMTASKHHRQNIEGNPIILNRFCIKQGINVQGGASKLFKYFAEWTKSGGYDRILSWSDSGWTEGEIYKTLGFKFEKEYDPDYFYWDMKNNIYVSKQSQMKSNTGCPPEITEHEWCKQHGLYRIWDCGKKLWTYPLTPSVNPVV